MWRSILVHTLYAQTHSNTAIIQRVLLLKFPRLGSVDEWFCSEIKLLHSPSGLLFVTNVDNLFCLPIFKQSCT